MQVGDEGEEAWRMVTMLLACISVWMVVTLTATGTLKRFDLGQNMMMRSALNTEFGIHVK